MLSSVATQEEDLLSYVTGKWLSPVGLRAVLKKAGVNIFPGEFSHNYVCVKKKVSAGGVGVPGCFLLGSTFWSTAVGQNQMKQVHESCQGSQWVLVPAFPYLCKSQGMGQV